ncbi:glycoside hydrolase family 76 protein, partial [Sphaerulina musiva SO2202]
PWEAWISASTHNTMIDYWHYAGNCTYANQTASGIISQAGPDNDFSAVSPGNDDALWWGLTCISAAEYGFPVPEEGPSTDWLCLAKNVFGSVISRWQPDMCGPGKGGIGWQVSTTSSGHEYKNAITQGLAFQLAARLAAITKERQYEVWANKIFDVSLQAGLIDNATYQVSDGVHAPGCSDVGDERWSYNVAVFMYGAAVMHRHTCSRSWTARSNFAENSSHILYEQRCEDSGTCNTDQQTFKAYLARWMGMTATLLPETRDRIMEVLNASAKAAIEVVNAGPHKNVASLKWTEGRAGYNESSVGVGAQLGVVEVV